MAAKAKKKRRKLQEEIPAGTLQKVTDLIQAYLKKPGGLIPALQVTQGMLGYLPEAVVRHIAILFRKSYTEVAGVVSFYSFFSTTPRGKYTIRVCLGTACYVRGGKNVLEALQQELQIEVGETTPDRLFSLEVGRCFGACSLAPVMLVNDTTHGRMKPHQVPEIIESYRRKEQESAKQGKGEDHVHQKNF